MEENTQIHRSNHSGRYDDENNPDQTCKECGVTFQKPLLTTVSSSGLVQTYHACPRCLTKIPENVEPQDEETKDPKMAKTEPSTSPEASVSCQHGFGYLGKRPKDEPIPESCLMCDQLVKCMAH